MPRFRHFLLFFLLLATACQSDSTAVNNPTQALASPLPTATRTSTLTPTTTASPTPMLTASPTIRLPSPTSHTPTAPPITTLLFTGIIVPARCVQAAIDALGNPDYPYEEVREIISQADLAIGTFNATMSDKVQHTGCLPETYQLVGSPQNADALARAGFDLMGVATNHIKDCGLMKGWCDYAFFDTLANLRRVGILYVGAGKDLTEALQPVVLTVNGVRFGFVSLGDSKQSESVFATETNPGIAKLNLENLQAAIAAARQISDVVIALPHWGSEENAIPNWIQRNQAQQLVAAGADLIVGNHTHVIQAIQTIRGVPVFYGLGNFVFDQGWGANRQGVILLVRFQGTRYLDYELIPTHVDRDGRVHIASPAEAAEILQRIKEVSEAIQ